ncbi:MAG: MBL fold metallo-hydrolase [Oscillospiraceae bacterium]|nr:MBL fold metallo-hydrolase [Oscillospiraceae bacterium]
MIVDLGNRAVNNYLISYEGGYILIDTGYAGGFPRFRRKLAARRIRPEEIRYVFLTHAHDDHAGFLNEVLELTGAQAIVHPAAIPRLQTGQNSFQGGCSNGLAWLFCQVLALCGHGEHRYPPIEERFLDRLVPVDSERFRQLQFPYPVIEAPGHTADHIALLAGDALFCGDAAMNGFPSLRRTTIWIEDLPQFRRSWETILALGPLTLYPAHGRPFPSEDLRKYRKSLDTVRLRPLRSAGGAEG